MSDNANNASINEVTSESADTKKGVNSSVVIPATKELLAAGVHFGHESKRWNPKMSKYIYGVKNNIHILDIKKTEEKLKEAVEFLKTAASEGEVLFVGTKRQASDIIREEAIRSGSYFIDERWAGGTLTNFYVVKKSLDKLNNIEKQLEEGVQDRTKYEVSRMKKEWQRLSRLYTGIKALNQKPTAIVIVDSNFEKSVIKEARKIKIPIVGILDTNCDPESVNYPIPANDDAINSIRLIIKTLADAVLEGNKGKGIVHNIKDYLDVEVKIVKTNEIEEDTEKVDINEELAPEINRELVENNTDKVSKSTKSSAKSGKGILERVKEEADAKKKK